MASVHSAAVKPSVRLWQCSPYHPSTILVPLIDYSIIPARRRKKTGHNFIGEILILFGGGCDPFFKYFDRFFISEIYLHKDKLQNSLYTCKSFLYAFYYFKKNCSFSHVTKKRIDTLMFFYCFCCEWISFFKDHF